MFDYLLKDFKTEPMNIPDAITIRQANTTDIPAIVRLVESVYRGESSRQGWTTEADLLEGQRTDVAMIAEMMDSPDSVFLQAEQSGELLASVLVERKTGYAYIGMLSVNVTAQNLKLGRRMIEECEKFASQEWQVLETRITVIERRRELVEWYQRRGYTLTGNTEEFPTDPRFGVPKVDRLYFVELSKPIA